MSFLTSRHNDALTDCSQISAQSLMKHLKKGFALAVVAAAWSPTLDAAPIIISDSTREIELTEGISYLSDDGGTRSYPDVLQSNDFTNTLSHSGPRPLTLQKYATTWIRFELKNIGPKDGFFYLSYDDKIASLIEVYTTESPSIVPTPQTGGRLAWDRTSLPTYVPTFFLDIPVGESRTILTKVSSVTTSPLVPKIMNPYGFAFRNNLTQIFWGLRLGAAFTLLIGLTLFYRRRRKQRMGSFLLYVIAMVVFLIAKETTTHQYMNRIFAIWLKENIVILLFLLVAARSYLGSKFLLLKSTSIQGYKLSQMMTIIAASSAIFSFLNPTVNLWAFAACLVFASFAISITLSYQIYRQGLTIALYFLLGSIFFGSFAAVAGAAEIGLFSTIKFFDITLFFGATLEMICMGIGRSKEDLEHDDAIALELKDTLDVQTQLKINHAKILEREKSAEFNDSIISNLPVPLLLLGQDLRVIRGNQRFHYAFPINIEEISAMLSDVDPKSIERHDWNLVEVRNFLLSVLENRNDVKTFIAIGRRKRTQLVLNISAQRIVSPNDNLPQLLLTIEDLSEVSHQNRKLSLAAEMAIQSNTEKTNFLANMSHEIRTPLAIIVGYADLLKKNSGLSPTQKSYIDSIVKSSTHLLALVNDVLDLSKFESGMLEAIRIEINLLSELQETFRLLSGRAKARGLYFNIEFEGPIPKTITTCPLRLRQIVINIVGNAIKFTETGGLYVKISYPSHGHLCIEVTDTGCGLMLLQQERLFQPFVQADRTTSRKYGGTGLGLALSRQLAKAMGGTIELCWSRINDGSSFIMTIDPEPTSNLTTIDDATWLSMNETIEKIAPQIHKWPDLRLLLVEDSPELCELIRIYLEATGAKLDVAVNGAEGVTRCLTNTYDLVLMDIQMPILDGYQATSKLIQLGYKVPIIALTGHAITNERERCLAIGFSDYLSKPITSQDLIAMILKYTSVDAIFRN